MGLLLASVAFAGEPPAVAYSLKEAVLSGTPGQTLKLELQGVAPKGFHTYSSKTEAEYGATAGDPLPLIPTDFQLEPASLLKISEKTTYTKPKVVKEEFTKKDIEEFEDAFSFFLTVQIAKDAKPGEHSGFLLVTYQICNAHNCFDGQKKLAFTLNVKGDGLAQLGTPRKGKSVSWLLKDSVITAARGQTVHVELQGAIPDGYHVYSSKTPEDYGNPDVILTPTSFTVAPETMLKQNGKATYSQPKLVKEIVSGVQIEVFEKTVTFNVPVQISKDATPGEYPVTLTVNSQICTEKTCEQPDDAPLNFSLKITDATVSEAAVIPTGSKTGLSASAAKISSELDQLRQKGSLMAYLLFALGAGATALLTPCVFPMIPITVSFFTKRKHVSRAQSIRDAGIYSLGIIFTFTGLGFAFALLLGASGITDFATNPWVNLGVATVFMLLAGSLFGWYEIQLPTGVLNKLNSKANEGEGITSVLLMGLVFSLTSFTCTVPFVGGVMVAATQGDWLWPLLGMLVFSTVFSLPFFLLALFPAALKSLPKSGGWLNSVKVVMGFLEIAAAMKFFSNVDVVFQWGLLKREPFLASWIILAVLAGAYLLGKIRFAHDTPIKTMSRFRVLAAGGFFSVALALTGSMFGLYHLGTLEAFVDAYNSEKDWIEDLEKGLAEAKKSGRPVFVDFTGYTCVNCRAMEKLMFPNAQVAPLMQKFVRVRLYTDGRSTELLAKNQKNKSLQLERYNTTALPYYVILSPNNDDIVQFKDGYTTDTSAFVSFLESGLKPKIADASSASKDGALSASSSKN